MMIERAENTWEASLREISYGDTRRKVVNVCEGAEVACWRQLKSISVAYPDATNSD